MIQLTTKCFLIGVCACLYTFGVVAQESEPHYYQVDLIRAQTGEIYDIEGEYIRLRYSDRYGKSPAFTVRILDWKSEVISEMNYAKKFGDNFYDLALGELPTTLEYGKRYTLVTHNDLNREYQSHFRLREPAEPEVPEVEILVDPVVMDCENPLDNLVRFAGKISGGRGPYTVVWEVFEQGSRQPLFVPRMDKVPKIGQTPIIELDSAPDYMVLVRVTDACGAEVENQVIIACGKAGKAPNTLFVQPVRPIPIMPSN